MKLIDADNVVLQYGGLAKISPDDFIGMAKYFSDQIKSMPEVDAVKVVRCKDCKYYLHPVCSLHSEEPDQYGPGFQMEMLPNDFCNYGDRNEH